jgi:hypothetical protein
MGNTPQKALTSFSLPEDFPKSKSQPFGRPKLKLSVAFLRGLSYIMGFSQQTICSNGDGQMTQTAGYVGTGNDLETPVHLCKDCPHTRKCGTS